MQKKHRKSISVEPILNTALKPCAVDLAEALPEAALETVLTLLPPLNILYKTVKKQDEKFKEICLNQLIQYLVLDIKRIKNKFNGKWMKTITGKKFCLKVISIAMNGEYAEKIEYFSHVLINSGSSQTTIEEKHKFLDILKNLSFIDLLVLAEIKKIYESRIGRKDREIKLNDVISRLHDKYDPFIIEAAFSSLVSSRVLSKNEGWEKSTYKALFGGEEEKTQYSSGGFLGDEDIAFYTKFTEKFVKFIAVPGSDGVSS